MSPIVDLRPTQSSRLINLSGRARVGSGEAAVIAGFVVESASPEPITRLMLRGVGPALSSFGVDGYAIDPQLTLHNDRGDAIASNDNWEDTPYTRHLTKEAGAFPLAPASNDSLLLHEFPRGLYSLQMRAKSAEGEGVALAEIYQLTPFPSFPPVPDELTNLSLRGRAGKGPDALIAGFVVRDPHELGRPLRLLIRAIGPTLAQFGIQSPVADPRLTVFDAAGRPLAANDDWAEGAAAAEIAAAGQRRGAFPLEPDSRDAALLIELPPGAYSIHATPTTGTGGIGLIELYRLSD